MQRLFHKQSAEAPLVEVAVAELTRLRGEPGYIWLDLAGEPEEAIWAVGEVFGLDAQSIEEAVGISLLPRIDEYEAYVFAVLSAPVSDTGQRLATGEMDLFISERFLVTIHREPSSAVEWVQGQAGSLSASSIESPAHLAAIISQAATRRYLPLIEQLEIRIDELEELAIAADPRALTEVHALRRDVVVLRRGILPQRDVFNDLAESLHPAIGRGAARVFDRIFDHHLKMIESLDGARNLLTAVIETYRGAVADETNEIVRVLTVFSAILLPMSVIAGIWGMNFRSIPAAEQEWGFLVMLGLMLALGVGLWVYFSRRGFVGRPRLRELPRSVGLGLIQIGTAPIKVVAGGIGSTVRHVNRRRDVASTETGARGESPPEDEE